MNDQNVIERSLAYERASELIEEWCEVNHPAGEDERGWYDISDVDEDWLQVAIDYLDARRLLERHPENPKWVIVRDESEPCAETSAVQS